MNPSDSPVPVVSYARISADLRRDEHGVQDQHKVNRQTAARYVPDVYPDHPVYPDQLSRYSDVRLEY
ncbi:hypothetical protein [Streptosporangium vulgare]|uniref:Resolvase/invertase-type recombinase catalytic domain-containing protein n=1 Tax=Streptosporangium vulgare TaxID=46190 RepID=A0ABV5TM25_9ACTN